MMDLHTVEGAGSENYSRLYHRLESMNMLVDYKRVATINVPGCSWERFIHMYMYMCMHASVGNTENKRFIYT